MNKYDMGLLTFRGLAVYSGICALEYSGKIFRLMPAVEEAKVLKWMVLAEIIAPPLILLACAIFLWLIAPILSKKMFTGSSVIEKSKIEFSDIKSLVFSAIGLLVLVETTPFLVKLLFFIFFASMSYSPNEELSGQINVLIVLNIVRITIGCFLFFGVKGVVRILSKLRRD